MGLPEILVGIILVVFLVVMTLMINPPEKWVKKFTEKDEDNKN